MNSMLNIDDYALHKTTGKIGQVVAYGHEMIDNAYLATLKVEVVDDAKMNKKTFVEDVTSNWMPVQSVEISEHEISQNVRSESSNVLTRV
jgi:hypothetical protein